MSAREGMLRAEFEDWYPGIQAGVWYEASWLATKVLVQQQMEGPTWALDERVLSSAHFSFRGGDTTRTGRRRGDHQGAARESGSASAPLPNHSQEAR